MTRQSTPPWSTGPGEILRHAVDLLRKDSDTNRRLAMISVDNSVELMIKTFLGLPKRVTGLEISRKEYGEFSESFPKLLDALEKYASDRLSGIDLGDIEWYHRLRNQLYHQGNGLTVEREKVEIYAQLANGLFTNLFGVRLLAPAEDRNQLLGRFMDAWVRLEQGLSRLVRLVSDAAERQVPLSPVQTFNLLSNLGVLSRDERLELDRIRQTRNRILHGQADHKAVLDEQLVSRVESFAVLIAERFDQVSTRPRE